ncbi:MAG: SCP2 sterol-binding domain-containing protein [Anaerolineales bacterium]|nr:SCP2 sterol-binding domain-containing protein [Anaerolineales bacterium]MDW8161021.1 SCP2 sterol-binding domain-containing protein [Anaerolineales bacterium]
MAIFPEKDWFFKLKEKLNSDERYAEIARNWEWDLLFVIEADEVLKETLSVYLDLWHGTCRDVKIVEDERQTQATFVLSAPYQNYVALLSGKLDPMQAMLTRKLRVRGNMAIMMRNVPTVLDFVRCCREITDGFVGIAAQK